MAVVGGSRMRKEVRKIKPCSSEAWVPALEREK